MSTFKPFRAGFLEALEHAALIAENADGTKNSRAAKYIRAYARDSGSEVAASLREKYSEGEL